MDIQLIIVLNPSTESDAQVPQPAINPTPMPQLLAALTFDIQREPLDVYGLAPVLDAYQFFTCKRFPQLQKEQPTKSPRDVLMQVATEWCQTMTEEDKEQYNIMCAMDKNRYALELMQYRSEQQEMLKTSMANFGEIQRQFEEKAHAKTTPVVPAPQLIAALTFPLHRHPLDANGVSPAMSAYDFYVCKRREDMKIEDPTMPFGQFIEQISHEWWCMKKTGEREEFEIMADMDEGRYQFELAQRTKEQARVSAEEQLQREIKTNKWPNWTTPFHDFWNANYDVTWAQDRSMTADEVMDKLYTEWKKMPAFEKQGYKTLCTARIQKYEADQAATRKPTPTKIVTKKEKLGADHWSIVALWVVEGSTVDPRKVGQFVCKAKKNMYSMDALKAGARAIGINMDHALLHETVIWAIVDHVVRSYAALVDAGDNKAIFAVASALDIPISKLGWDVPTAQRTIRNKLDGMYGLVTEASAVVTKKVKDPNMPKRHLSAYLYYAAERRPELKKEDPTMPFGDLTKQIAAEWTHLKKNGKTKEYDDLASLDKERYEKEMAEYQAKLGQTDMM